MWGMSSCVPWKGAELKGTGRLYGLWEIWMPGVRHCGRSSLCQFWWGGIWLKMVILWVVFGGGCVLWVWCFIFLIKPYFTLEIDYLYLWIHSYDLLKSHQFCYISYPKDLLTYTSYNLFHGITEEENSGERENEELSSGRGGFEPGNLQYKKEDHSDDENNESSEGSGADESERSIKKSLTRQNILVRHMMMSFWIIVAI